MAAHVGPDGGGREEEEASPPEVAEVDGYAPLPYEGVEPPPPGPWDGVGYQG